MAVLPPRSLIASALTAGATSIPFVTRGLEVEPLAPGVWAVPDWRLFEPACLTGREALGRQLP